MTPPMITPERLSQGVYDLLLEFNSVDPNTYEYDELRTLLIELTKDGSLHLYNFLAIYRVADHIVRPLVDHKNWPQKVTSYGHKSSK